jgi:autotransporter-associated beta strand protein
MKSLLRNTRAALLATAATLFACTANSATVIWNATNGVYANTNWSTATNWLGNAAPATPDDVKFFDNGSVTPPATTNNVVDVSFTIGSLQFGNTNKSHTTLIAPGVTLTLTNANGLTAGTETVTPSINSQQETNGIAGPGGTLVMNNTNATVNVRQCGTSASNGSLRSTFDMSDLDTFIATIANVKVGQQISSTVIRATGTLLLAKTNTLTLSGQFLVGDTANNAGGQNIANLGQTNTIFTDNLTIGLSKGLGLVRFNPVLSSPNLYLRGKSATRVAAVNIGDASLLGPSTAATTGIWDMSGGTVDAQVGTMYVGRGQPSTASSGPGTGTLTLTSGTFDADVTELGFQQSTVASIATGTLNINGPVTYIVNTSLRLAHSLGSGGVPVGTLNVTNGTILVKGNIVAGGGTSTLNMTNGTIIATNGSTVGASSAKITTLNLNNSTLTLSAFPSGAPVVASTFNNSGSNTINVVSLPSISGYPMTFPMIGYDSISGDPTAFILGSLPGSFQGYLSSSGSSIDLIVTNGPPPAKSLTWDGTVNALWDTSTANWKTNPANASLAYNQGDFVTFDDTLTGSNTVNLTTSVTPGGLAFNNSTSNYLFIGTGKISGNSALNKQGSATLTLANSGVNDFSGGVANASGSTLQIGTNGSTGNLPAVGSIANDGSLVFDRNDTITVPNTITGAGSLTQIGNGTLTISGNNTFSSGLAVNSGTVRLVNATSAGSGNIAVNTNATLVAGSAHANAITMSGATLGGVPGIAGLAGDLTLTSGNTNSIYISDPQNLAANSEMIFTGTLHGDNTTAIVALSGTNNISPDGGVGYRLRGTASDFFGTITIGHNVKGELQTGQAGPFSPAGSAKIFLTCGDAALGNSNFTVTLNGGYCELNVRNNNSGDTTFGNDIQLVGTGLALLNPLGTAPSNAVVNLGTLTIGNGQELGVFLNTGNPHIVAFPSVVLAGGTAKFSPKPPGFNPITAVGSDFSVGNISQSTPGSGFVMNGLRTLSITGTATYSGATTVSNGFLRVMGTLSNTPTAVNGGTLTGTGSVAGAVTETAGGTIAPGDGSIGTFTVSNNVSLGGTLLIEVNKDVSPGQSNDVLNVTGTVSCSGTIVATNIGATALALGDNFQILPAGGTGSMAVSGSPGAGLSWSFSPASGILSVITTPSAPTNSASILKVTQVGTNMVIHGTNNNVPNTSFHYAVLSATNLTLPLSNWTVLGTNSFNPDGTFDYTNPISPATPRQFIDTVAVP